MAKNYEKSGIKTSLMLGGNISLTILAHFQEMLHVACLDAAKKLGFEICRFLIQLCS